MTVRSIELNGPRTLNPSAEQTIYDRRGTPLAYVAVGGVIYGFGGSPIAYVYRARTWTFPGEQVGWFDQGWLRTLSGACIGFTAIASSFSGPSKPSRLLDPQKLQKKRNSRAIGIRRIRAVTQPLFKKRWCRAPLSVFLSWVQFDAGA